MKKINIVKDNLEFNNIIQNSKKVKNQYFVIYYEKNNLNRYRFGISVGHKLGNAVLRNKYKRRIKNILDNYKNIYSKNRDYIIILRKSCLNLSYQEIEENLINLIKLIEKE